MRCVSLSFAQRTMLNTVTIRNTRAAAGIGHHTAVGSVTLSVRFISHQMIVASVDGSESGWQPGRRIGLSCHSPWAKGLISDLAANSTEPPLAGRTHFLVQVVPPPSRHVGQPGFGQLEPVEEAQDIRTAAVHERGV